ncbi:MAG: BMP family ABC transporter substrate-binding protein [Clostridia bacterium]|nr:BMP family ABC transporter substrate-binding protein [Clostridia bacterium]
MSKKLLAFLMAALMVVSMLALSACDGKKDDATSDTGSKTEVVKGETAPLLPAPAIEKFAVADDFKIGVICLHDENSTYDNNFIRAINNVKTALGLTDEQVIVKTNIPESSECKDAANELAAKGCKIVFADSFGHEEHMIEAAKANPTVQFCHATGTRAHTEGLANYHNAFASIYEGRYLAGIAAGLKLNEMISSGKITADQAIMGYVGAFTYAEVISGLTSFYLGAKSVCPSVTMKVRYTGSWYDQALEQEAANALIKTDKCVLISQHADSLGAPSACEAEGVPNVSYNGSTYAAGENTFIISSAINWESYFAYIIKQVTDGNAIDADWTGDIEAGSVVLTGLNSAVAAEGTKDAIDKAIADFKAGTLHVFSTDAFTVDGKALTSYLADVDYDAAFEKDTEVIADGYFHESEFRSAPYFDLRIDGIEFINEKY